MTNWYYLIQRHDDKSVSLWPTRHDAAGWKALYHDICDYEIIPVPAAAVPHLDVRNPDHENRVAGHPRYD